MPLRVAQDLRFLKIVPLDFPDIRPMVQIRSIVTSIITCWLAAGMGVGDVAAVYGQTARELHLDAIAYYTHQQWEDSVELFAELTNRFPGTPESADAHFFLAEALMQVERYQDAYLAYQKFMLTSPADDLAQRSLFRMGEAAFRQGNNTTGVRLLEIFARNNPDHKLLEYALPYLGELRLAKGEPQLAQKVFERSLELHPSGELAHRSRFGLARCLHQQGYFADAVRMYRFIAEADNSPLAGRAALQVAQIHLSDKAFEPARAYLEKALLSLEDTALLAEATYWLARVHAEHEEYAIALDLLNGIETVDLKESLTTAILLDSAQLAAKIGNAEQSIRDLNQLIKHYPQAREIESALLLKMDICRLAKHRESEFEDSLQQFTQSFPNSPHRIVVWERAAHYFFDQKRYEQAEPWFDQLLEHARSKEERNLDLDRWICLAALNSIGLGDFQTAESSLTQIQIHNLEADLQPLVHFAIATSRFGLKKFNAAIPAYQNYLNLVDRENKISDSTIIKRAHRELTICLAEAEMWSEAAQAFRELNARFGTSDEVLEIAEFLADRAFHSEVNSKAIEFLEFLLANSSQNEKEPNYLSALGWIRLEQDEKKIAEAHFRDLILKYPKHDLVPPAAMLLAKNHEEAGQISQAIDIYSVIINHFHDRASDASSLASLRLAYLLQKPGQHQNLKRARILLDQYLEKNRHRPEADEASYQLGWVLLAMGEKEEAMKTFSRLLNDFPHSKYFNDTNLRLAQFELKQGLVTESHQRVETLMQQSNLPTDLRLQVDYLAGEIAVQQNRWPEIDSLTKSLISQTSRPDIAQRALYWLAESKFRQGQFELSAEMFDRLIEQWNDLHRVGIDPNIAPWLWLRAAQSAIKMDQWKRAETSALEGIRQFPSFTHSYEFDFIRARVLENAGRLSDAREIYQSIVESNEASNTETAARAQWRIGETYFHQEEYAQAIRAYYRVDTAFSYETWRAAALLQAGKCQERLNNLQQAERLYKRLIEQFPTHPLVTEATERLSQLNHTRFTNQHFTKQHLTEQHFTEQQN